jgi:hypothetical protein
VDDGEVGMKASHRLVALRARSFSVNQFCWRLWPPTTIVLLELYGFGTTEHQNSYGSEAYQVQIRDANQFSIWLPKMPSLLLTVFLLQLAIHLVNTFGASSINALV